MIEDDDEEKKGPVTEKVVEGEDQTAGPNAFTTDDIRDDLKGKLRRRLKRGPAAPDTTAQGPDVLPPAALWHPLKVAYVIVGVSALLTAGVSALLLHLIGGTHLSPTTRWLAPLAGAGMFALLGVLLARSTVKRPK